MDILSITKKDFKERISVHTYKGRGQYTRHAVYFDWKTGELSDGKFFAGFKYMVKGYGFTKAEMINNAYNLITGRDDDPMGFFDFKYAETDGERFKVSLVG
jgi:hypothetical protein